MNLQVFIDSANYKHSRRVSEISGLLAGYMGYSGKEVNTIKEAAQFHDLGKQDIPKEILTKSESLTSKEFGIVKRHAKLGSARIKDAIRILSAACIIAENHHEKLDGSGYHHLPAEEIHPFAKLVTVADVFDALYSKRDYKRAWDLNTVLCYLKRHSGKQFDEDVISALLLSIDEIKTLY